MLGLSDLQRAWVRLAPLVQEERVHRKNLKSVDKRKMKMSKLDRVDDQNMNSVDLLCFRFLEPVSSTTSFLLSPPNSFDDADMMMDDEGDMEEAMIIPDEELLPENQLILSDVAGMVERWKRPALPPMDPKTDGICKLVSQSHHSFDRLTRYSDSVSCFGQYRRVQLPPLRPLLFHDHPLSEPSSVPSYALLTTMSLVCFSPSLFSTPPPQQPCNGWTWTCPLGSP